MNWKAKVAAFVKQLGPACKFTAKTVLSTLIPGSPAVIELVEMALDCGSDTADNVWEVEKDSAAVRDLERIGTLLETMQTQMGADLKQIAGQVGRPDEARRILDEALANNARLREVGEQLQSMAAGFDRLEVQMDRVAGRQEMSLDMQQQMLELQRLSIGLMLTMYGENGNTPELREQFRSALAALGAGRVAAAYPALTALVKVLPGSSAVQGAFGVLQAVDNDLPGAQVSLARATRLNPTNPALQKLSERVTQALTGYTPVTAVPGAPLRVGQVLGGWEIIQLLGSGGSGQVVKGRKAEQIAALKVLHPRLSRDEAILSDFRKEMMALMQLRRQRHLAEILDFGFCEQQRRYYFVMTFVQGMSLQTYLDRHGLLSLEQAVRCFRPVAEALGRAHALEIFHRDIKPANLLRADDGSLTLLDFGLAGAAMARGTLAFTSPEQLRGQPGDARSDVYSLAATLYHALTRQPPDHFERGSIAKAELADLLAQSLANNPRARPANAADFAARLVLPPQTLTVPDDYATIQTALNMSCPGDTVLVRRGEYRETLYLPQGVTLRGENRDRCRILPASGAEHGLKAEGLTTGVVENLTFDGEEKRLPGRDGVPHGVVIVDSTITINRCAAVRWAGAGVSVRGAKSAPTLRNNQCRRNVGPGIYYGMGATGTVEANVCEENQRSGILVDDPKTTPKLRNNQCRGNVEDGVHLATVPTASPIPKRSNRKSKSIATTAYVAMGILGFLVVFVVISALAAKKGEVLTNSIGMDFRYIYPGTFLMGSPEGEHEHQKNETQHWVTLKKGYYLQTTLVTQKQWKAVMGEDNNPSRFKGDDLPVDSVSWKMAKEFCDKLNTNEGKNYYRLPTEAEWEYAARAGTTTPFWQAETITTKEVNFNGKYPYRDNDDKGEYRGTTTPVKHFEANPWGLHDMGGNLWQWCEDFYKDYPKKDIDDRQSPQDDNKDSSRVLRGGSWLINARNSRAATRHRYAPAGRDVDFGFRVAFCLD